MFLCFSGLLVVDFTQTAAMVGAVEYDERDIPGAYSAAARAPLLHCQDQGFHTRRLSFEGPDTSEPLLPGVHANPSSPTIKSFTRAELKEQISSSCQDDVPTSVGYTDPVTAVRRHLSLQEDPRCRKFSGKGVVCPHTPSSECIVQVANDNCDEEDGFELSLFTNTQPQGLHRSPSQENIWALLFTEKKRERRQMRDSLDDTQVTFLDETELSSCLEREGSSRSLDRPVKVEVSRRHFSDSVVGMKSYRPSVRFYIGDGSNTEDESSEDCEMPKKTEIQEEDYPRYGAKTGRVGSISCPLGPGFIVNQSQVPICRICLYPGDDREGLITPCRCAGTMKHVHYTCLMVSICSFVSQLVF